MRRRYARGVLGLLGLCALGLALWSPVAWHVRAARLLLGFQSPESQRGEPPADVAIEETTLAGARAVRYGGRGRPILLLHGAHPGGVDEPRLRAFAGQLAARGFDVHCPSLDALAALRLDPATVIQARRAAEALARARGVASVGVVGISVGGGVALRAATETDAIHAVFAIGAHHDLAGLLDGWIASPEERYGAEALAHAFEAEYFESPDAAAALTARLLGGEAPRLEGDAAAELAALRADPMPPEAQSRLRAIVARHADALARMSPRGAIADLSAPVFLLHGERDPLVPPTESEAIFAALPERARGGLVRTPLLRHAEGADAGLAEQWRVVHLAANALDAL